MKHPIGLLAWIPVVVAFSSSSHAGIDEIPSPYQRDVRCMLQVLQKTRHVDQVGSGVLSYGWTRPFVRYRYQETDGRVGTVTFVGAKPHDPELGFEAPELPDSKIYYTARLDGLGHNPSSLGTRWIVMRWRWRCGVSADALFV
jgi:hypothetical protein